VRVEELVGQRIRAQRERLGLTQDQLGRRLGDKLGRSWSRQAVSAAEKGDRAFTAAELLAIAFTLQVSVGHLLVPPAGVNEVEMPNGATLSRDDLVTAVLPDLTTERAFDLMQASLGRLSESVVTIQAWAGVAAKEVQVLNDGMLLAEKIQDLNHGKLPADRVLSAGDEP
jgi:transcriptional regulator with XRE-family HTH domain